MPSLTSQLIYLALKVFVLFRLRSKQTLIQMRANQEKLARRFKAPPGVNLQTILIDNLELEWVVASNTEPDRVILYLHGGGYVLGTPRLYHDLAVRLSKASRARVLLVEYRLAPEHPFPAAIEDGLAAYGWLLDNGFKPSQITIAGESAGGGLAVATTLALRDLNMALPAGIVAISPWADLECSSPSFTERARAEAVILPNALVEMAAMYAGSYDLRHPLISPLYADLRGLPPLLIQVGSQEVLLDDALRLAARARAAGVETHLENWPGMWHVWHYFAAFMPEAHQAIEQIGQFIRRKPVASFWRLQEETVLVYLAPELMKSL